MMGTSSEDASRVAHAAILAQLAEGVIVTDAIGRITFVNRAAETIHGVALLDVEPDQYSDTYRLFTEDGKVYPSRNLPLTRAVRGEIVRDERWRILRPDGTAVLAVGSARPLLGTAGRQIGAVLTMRDDTARDAAERKLRRFNVALSERVAERTREAEAAREVAEDASRAKTEFLAAISHEIRAPLSGILGYTELLLEEKDPAAIRRCGERIRSAGAALLTIVNDLLDFAQVEAGRVELVLQPFGLTQLAEEAAGIVRGIAERKGLALAVDLGRDLPEQAIGDADRLRQVLLHLLNNAVKFTRSGSVRLSIRAISAEPLRLRFEVEDTGIGIASAKRDLLFERFSRIDGSNQREHSGTSLGLAISKRLVELMGGAIGFDSELGRGSLFWFEVALGAAGQAQGADIAHPMHAASGRRLLLVEDVVANQELARELLERAGHKVQVASGGAEAVAAVQKTHFDLVLMDVQMPVIDGLAATRLIRALDHPAARVPIVAMSANVLPHQVALCREAGMQDHVGKPFKREDLLAAIDRWARPAPQSVVPATTQTDVGQFDQSTFDALSGPIGAAAMRRLLGAFARELRDRIVGGEIESPPVVDTHALMSAAGMLGFTAFAALCREAQTAKDEQEAARLAQQLQVGGRRVLATVERLVAAA